jgi:ornithine cyclodeaminase
MDDPIRYLTEAQTRLASARLDPVAVIRDVLVRHAKQEVVLPAEAYLGWTTATGASARSINMPAMVLGADAVAGTKVINASLDNIDRGLPRASGLTMLFDVHTGRIRCVMAAAHVSALRTAAVSVAAASELVRPGASRVAVIGSGAIAESHARLLAGRLTGIRELAVYDHVPDRAAAFAGRAGADLAAHGVAVSVAGSARAAVEDADLVLPCTTTTTPYIELSWLRPGAVVVNVSLDDVGPDVVAGADLLLVDDWSLVRDDAHRLLGRMHRAGELTGPDETPRPGVARVHGELGEVFAGVRPGRVADDQTILVNPFGMAVEDVALAAAIDRIAAELDLGTALDR